MAFDDKTKELNKAMGDNAERFKNFNVGKVSTENPKLSKEVERRQNRSYTILPSISDELKNRAEEQGYSASRYLEIILKEKFNIT